MSKTYKIEINEREEIKKSPKELQSHNFLESFGPLFTIEHAFGILRFSVKNKELLRASGIRKTLGMCLVLVITSITYVLFSIAVHYRAGGVIVTTLKLVPSATLLVNYIVTAVLYSFRMCEANVSIISSFVKLDSILHIDMNKKMYNAPRMYAFWILAFIVCYNVTFILWYYFSTNLTMFGILLTSVLFFVQDIEILIFCFMINALKDRLSIINLYLKNMPHSSDHLDTITVYTIDSGKNTKVKANTEHPNSLFVSNLHELATAYDIIGSTSKLINRVFNFQIFACLIATFFITLLTLWMVLYTYQKKNLPRGFLTTVCWDISHMCFVLAISIVCQRLLIARNCTICHVNELVMDYGLPAEMRAQAKAFMELIDTWPLRIHIFDMFPVDITLIVKFISVSTTYLIVLIQLFHVN